MQIHNKIIFLLILLFTFLNSEAAQNYPEITSDSVSFSVTSPINFSLPDSVINYGKLFLKTPYRYGSPGVNSFDCSGFTSYVYRNFGYNLERSSSDQADQFPLVKRNQIKTGDLVFFEGRRHNGRVGHVGIVVATNDSGHFDFIHAAVHSGVTISNSKESYYLKRFVRAGRIIGSDTDARIKGATPKMTRDEYVSYEPANSVKVSIPAKYHKVKKGENLSIIAEKYGLTVATLKQKNNLKKNNISINQRLKIKSAESYTKAETILTDNSASASNKTPENEFSSNTLHTVKKGETLNSISKLYNISVSELKNLNNLDNNKISIGQDLRTTEIDRPIECEKLPQLSETKITETKPEKTEKIEKVSENKGEKLNHKIKKGESLFSIAKTYNMSVEELKLLNGLPDSKIQPGQVLLVSQNEFPEKTENKTATKNHKVKSGESLYSIAKTYGCTVAELKDLNGRHESNLSVGDMLKVRD